MCSFVRSSGPSQSRPGSGSIVAAGGVACNSRLRARLKSYGTGTGIKTLHTRAISMQ